MSEKYRPLYRKYRPQTFYDLIGQEHITTALSNAIELSRISHAYLFCGPRGTGKTSSARILAKSLNCTTGPTLKPCGTCPSCVDIINATPMDVIEIDAASNRGIEDTQKILEKIQYVPVHGKYKIYVIDEVHMLSATSFNALLKTLEEPPENVIFILATTEPQKVLETIISRCQRFDFKRITTDDIVKRLKFIAEQEKIKITDPAIHNIAKNSAGGMRDSLSLLDQVSILDVKKEIDVEDIDFLLGKISNDILFDLTGKILAQSTSEAIALIDTIYNKGNEPAQVILNLIQYLRNLLVLNSITDAKTAIELTQLSQEYIEKMKPQAQQFENSQLIYLIEKLSSYLREVRMATNRYLWLELCIIDITTTKYSSYNELLERVEQLEAAVTTGNVPAAPPKFVPPPKIAPVEQTPKATPMPIPVEEEPIAVKPKEEQPKPVQAPTPAPVIQETSVVEADNSNLSYCWGDILENIEHTPSRVLFTSKAQPVEVNASRVVVTFANEIFVNQAKDATKLAALQSAVNKYFQADNVNIQIRLKQDNDKVIEVDTSASDKKKIANPPQAATSSPEPISEKHVPDNSPAGSDMTKEDESDNLDDGYYDTLLKDKKETPPALELDVYSDQANMVLSLFSGKLVD